MSLLELMGMILDPEKFKVERALGHVKELSQTIGPRLAGSPGDREAENYIEQQFDDIGLETWTEEFELVDRSWDSGLRALGFVVAFVAALFLPPEHSLALLAIAFALTWLVPRVAIRGKSRNVIGRISPQEGSKLRLLITSHHDSALDLVSQRLASVFSRLSILVVFVFAGALVLRFFREPPVSWEIYWLVLAAFFLPAFGWQLFINLRRKGTPGANDNASGVAVMLEVARRVSEESPSGMEFWFVSFGAEEQGLWGSRDLLDNHSELRENTYVLNLDMVGSGNPCVIEGSGIPKSRETKTHSVLNRMLELASAGQGSDFRMDWLPFSSYDHLPFVELGVPATSLSAGRYGSSLLGWLAQSIYGLPVGHVHRYPYSHTSEDTLDRIEEESLDRAGRITLEFVNRAGTGLL